MQTTCLLQIGSSVACAAYASAANVTGKLLPPRACADFLDVQQPLLMGSPILMHTVVIAWTVIFFAGDGYAHSSAMTLLRCSAQEMWL